MAEGTTLAEDQSENKKTTSVDCSTVNSEINISEFQNYKLENNNLENSDKLKKCAELNHHDKTYYTELSCSSEFKIESSSSSCSSVGPESGQISSVKLLVNGCKLELSDAVDPVSCKTSNAATTEDSSRKLSMPDDISGSEGSRRHAKSSSLPHGVKLCSESNSPDHTQQNNNGIGNEESEKVEEKWIKLEEELKKAHAELKEKDDEVEKLKDIRKQVEEELDDLTSSLFLEAHKMVQEAKMKEVSSEKCLRETKMQLEGLQAEVAALKTLLITSTPSRPNLGKTNSNGISIFKKQHKRTPSHNQLQYGRSEFDNETDNKTRFLQKPSTEGAIDRDRCEIDPVFHKLFSEWREEPTLNKDKTEFLKVIYIEEIEPCLNFPNQVLVKRLIEAIHSNSVWVEPFPEKEKTNIPKECALIQCPRLCNYRMRFSFDSEEWFDITQLSRDRIAAVIEFLNYLRYIKNGLVKASVDDSYFEIIRLRKQMALAKLGIPISS